MTGSLLPYLIWMIFTLITYADECYQLWTWRNIDIPHFCNDLATVRVMKECLDVEMFFHIAIRKDTKYIWKWIFGEMRKNETASTEKGEKLILKVVFGQIWNIPTKATSNVVGTMLRNKSGCSLWQLWHLSCLFPARSYSRQSQKN